MATKASTSEAAAAPEADTSKSMFTLPSISVPDVTAPSPSQALIKAGDILTTTVATISVKAGQALEVFGTAHRHFYRTNSVPLSVGAICLLKLFDLLVSSWQHSGTVAAHHAFLGCAYFERFHNQKIKAFFRETVYAETREKIVINWVLNKASCTVAVYILFPCYTL
jgi:hypothetical protein